MLVGCGAPPGWNGVRVVEALPGEVCAVGKLQAEHNKSSAAASKKLAPRQFDLLSFDAIIIVRLDLFNFKTTAHVNLLRYGCF
jgi:hypothetical protein